MKVIANQMGHDAAIRFGETNRLAHGGRPAQGWRNILKSPDLLNITGGVKPKNIGVASDAVRKYISGLQP